MDERGRWYLRSKSYYSFGAAIHKVLERLHDGSDTDVSTLEEAMGAYEESWIDTGFSSPEEMQEAFGDGKELLQRYMERHAAAPSQAKVLMVEKQLRMAFGEDFDLIGRLDRLDEHPDGTLEIIDYKSGRQEVSAEDVHSDIAMSIYQLLLRERYPDRPIRATIVALRSGTSATASLSGEELDVLKQDLWELGRMILGANWEERTPNLRRLCRTCDFLPLCQRDREFAAELASSVNQDSGIAQ